MGMETPAIERRKFFRHRISVPLHLSHEDSSSPFVSDSADLSLGGLCFLWKNKLPKGKILNVTIPVKERFFVVQGKVCYCREDRKSGRYRTGISFMDGSSAFKAKLAEEALEIIEYRKKLSKEQGREVPEEEAARQWIQHYASQFSNQS